MTAFICFVIFGSIVSSSSTITISHSRNALDRFMAGYDLTQCAVCTGSKFKLTGGKPSANVIHDLDVRFCIVTQNSV